MSSEFRETSLVQAQPLSEGVLDHILALPTPVDCSKIAVDMADAVDSAIVIAGMRLRYMPDQPITEAPIYLNDEQQSDFRSRVLQVMINASIARPSEITDPAFTCVRPEGIDACGVAEPYFINTLHELGTSGHDKPKADIITSNGSPVLLTKLSGVRTSLALRDVSIDGIPYPAGSIVYTVSSQEKRQEADAKRGKRAYRLYDAGDVTSLGFIRLSQFAIPVDQQPKRNHDWDDQDYGITWHQREKVRQTRVGAITAVVEAVLSRNG